jgi:hypothetical protein
MPMLMEADGPKRSIKSFLRALKSSEKIGFRFKTTSVLELALKQDLTHKSFLGSFRERRSSKSY